MNWFRVVAMVMRVLPAILQVIDQLSSSRAHRNALRKQWMRLAENALLETANDLITINRDEETS